MLGHTEFAGNSDEKNSLIIEMSSINTICRWHTHAYVKITFNMAVETDVRIYRMCQTYIQQAFNSFLIAVLYVVIEL